MEINVNFARIESAIDEGCQAAAKQVYDAVYDAIADPVYAWPIGESPRDIIDTGELQNSQRYQEDGYASYVFSWDVPYAHAVFTGYVTKSGSIMPARNPVDLAFAKNNFSTIFVESIRSKL